MKTMSKHAKFSLLFTSSITLAAVMVVVVCRRANQCMFCPVFVQERRA
jgi:hypothetical protein